MICKRYILPFFLAMLLPGLSGSGLRGASEIKLPELNGINDRFYMAYPVTVPPEVDGKLEKEFWEKLPFAKYFTVNNLQTNSVSCQTHFRIAYDSRFLYIGARMFEPFPEKIKDGKGVADHLRDRINFIFSKTYKRDGSYRDSPYMFLLYEPGGRVLFFRNELPAGRTSPVPITGEWLLAYGKERTSWVMEARIPFSSLGFSPKDGRVFFNVRRDNPTGPVSERESMWSQRINPGLGAHSFGTLIFNRKPGNVARDSYWLNAKPRFWYQYGILQNIGEKKGDYLKNFQMFGKEKNWEKVEKAAGKIGKFFAENRKKGIGKLISDEVDIYYMEYLQALAEVYKASPPRALQIPVKDAVITSVSLNGKKILPRKGEYLLPMYSGIHALEIHAKANGGSPGIRIALEGSPETSRALLAFTTRNKKIPLSVKDGYLWAGKEKNLIFRQQLIWNREYCNFPYAFISPNVKKWGVSPGETMHFIHKISKMDPAEGKCSYTLIMEIPEGFRNLPDHSGTSIFNHYPTKDVKEEKILFNNEKYLRYTYNWLLPEKLERGLSYYLHYISVKHETYDFSKGKNPVVRFRRILNGNTVDIVNTIPLSPLPPIRGGKLKKIHFPQYSNFAGGYVSFKQFEEMVKGSVAAGLDSFIAPAGNFMKDSGTRNHKLISIQQKYAKRNFVWAPANLPLWGAGYVKGATRSLVESTADLRAVHYDEKGGFVPNYFMDFCMTKAVGKYRKEFYAALVKDYKRMIRISGIKEIFINDENMPQRRNGTWTNSLCFCKECKKNFFHFAKLPPREISNKLLVTKYEKEWEKFWKHTHKKELLSLVYSAVKAAGGILSYYHSSSDIDSVIYAKGLTDRLFVTVPGCATFTGSKYQPTLDHAVKKLREITGVKHQTGQFRTYMPEGSYSSDGCYFHPEETKLQLLRLAASLHGGAIWECASFMSAGALYYAGEATRLIGEYEDIFYNGERKDSLAGGTFQYPDKLVLVKGKERLVLLFNEGEKPVSGILENLELPKGAKAKVRGEKTFRKNPGRLSLTIPPKDAVAIHIQY